MDAITIHLAHKGLAYVISAKIGLQENSVSTAGKSLSTGNLILFELFSSPSPINRENRTCEFLFQSVFVGRAAMAMQHLVRAAMVVTAMNMEVKLWVFVTFKLVSASVRTIQWVIIVTNANLAIMETQGLYFFCQCCSFMVVKD